MPGRCAVLFAALGLAACGSAPVAAPTTTPAASGATGAPIRLAASQNVAGNAPVWLTSQAGLFRKNGVNTNLQSVSATLAIKQVVAGQLDALVAGAPESITARAAGAPIQIVAVFQTACDMIMVAPSGVSSVDQLKGKTVAVITKPSVNGICTVADLRKHGLLPGKDYALIEAGTSGNAYANTFAALQAHNADAAALQPDVARKLTDGGQFHALYDLAAEPDLLTAASSLTVAASFIQEHPADVQKTLDSLLQGQALFKQDRNQALDVLRSTFKITDPNDLDNAYSRLVQLFATDVTPRKELFPDLIDGLGQIQDSVKTMDLNALLDPSFAQEAMNRGLTKY